MLVVASKWDDVIPFEGVQKYVNKLKLCVKQHRFTIGQESGRNTWMSFLPVNARDLGAFTRSSVPRGTILLEPEIFIVRNQKHWHTFSSNQKQVTDTFHLVCGFNC